MARGRERHMGSRMLFFLKPSFSGTSQYQHNTTWALGARGSLQEPEAVCYLSQPWCCQQDPEDEGNPGLSRPPGLSDTWTSVSFYVCEIGVLQGSFGSA